MIKPARSKAEQFFFFNMLKYFFLRILLLSFFPRHNYILLQIYSHFLFGSSENGRYSEAAFTAVVYTLYISS